MWSMFLPSASGIQKYADAVTVPRSPRNHEPTPTTPIEKISVGFTLLVSVREFEKEADRETNL